MAKSCVLVAVAALCAGPAWCQSSAPPARSPPIEETHELRPPPPNPAEVPAWMSHAVGDILSGKATLPDDADGRKP